ncbi:MAG: SGNH/GDSL hydrolase family protein [Cyclobacteriaceae bacterium]
MKKLSAVLITSVVINSLLLACSAKITPTVTKGNSQITTVVASENNSSAVQFVYASVLKILGKFHAEEGYHRLPATFQDRVRPPVWSLSRNTAGLAVRFATNAPALHAKWGLSGEKTLSNMTGFAVSGLDLYAWVGEKWQYVNSGVPRSRTNDKKLISDMDSTLKEFLLYLPLYNGVESLSIGTDSAYSILPPQQLLIQNDEPIVFYGTSITQGASASRPGMAYPSIISRRLNREVVNLGFSGNGLFEAAVGEALCQIEAGLYVIDCTHNAAPDIIKANARDLIRQLHRCWPDTPILLVESIIREYAYFKTSDATTFGSMEYLKAQNASLSRTFQSARQEGIENIYYLPADDLLGDDHEGTTDGTHLSDLGNYRMAAQLEKQILSIIEPK